MIKKLYLVTTNSNGNFYVIATNPSEAEQYTLEVIESANRITYIKGYALDKHITNIQWLSDAIEINSTEGNKIDYSDKNRLIIH